MPIPQVPSPLAVILATDTYDSNWFPGLTLEDQIQSAIDHALADGVSRVLVHKVYDATKITFSTAVRMVLEGSDPGVYNIMAYGAAGNGIQDDATAIQAAINGAQTTDGSEVVIPTGHFRTLTSPVITSDHLSLRGHGPALSTLQPENGPGLTLNTTDGSVFGPTIRYLGFRPTVAASGKYLLDVVSGLPSLSNLLFSCPSSGGIASGWAGAIRLQEVNGCEMRDIRIQGLDTDLWPIGIDICPNVTGNRGNVTIIGGFVNRCTTAIRIANGASGLVNNIQLFGTKILFNGSGTAVGGIGIKSATMRLLTLHGVHIESHDVSCELTQVLGANIKACRFVNFGTPAGGANQIGLSLKSACDAIEVGSCEFDSGAVGVGTAINSDATAHQQITLLPNRYLKFATLWNDLSTGSMRAIFASDTSQRRFWLKDRIVANAFQALQGNLTLASGNNNNLALPSSTSVRATIDAAGSALTGIVAPTGTSTAGGYQIKFFKVAGAGAFTVTNNDGSSSAGNRILTTTAGTITVTWCLVLEYDSSSTVWRVVSFV